MDMIDRIFGFLIMFHVILQTQFESLSNKFAALREDFEPLFGERKAETTGTEFQKFNDATETRRHKEKLRTLKSGKSGALEKGRLLKRRSIR